MTDKTLSDAELATIVGGLDTSKTVAAVSAQRDAYDRKIYAKLGMCPCGQNHY